MDAYEKGLNGKQAAWASKKYWGHQVLPESIMMEHKANVNKIMMITGNLHCHLQMWLFSAIGYISSHIT